MADKKLPSELQSGAVWDKALERFAINTGAGIVGGLIASVVVARAPGFRKMVIGFGTGCGVGAAWVKASQDFEKIDDPRPLQFCPLSARGPRLGLLGLGLNL
eukprot:CAMPEP_0118868214 /NCGR_PEP_ID=MMETSP1163-20130328/11676_1 /TAXON_ID=124430 /ORGANISM="Phaeomonas parva, Strain CCMP2877" /LENGTH=101 /DNA_ID=CAMNT_0006802831 /DNA_START=134 /DNA_END=440 /DNA_ORIENTATION=+